MDIVGCSLFGSRYLRSAAPPQVNSRHMPCASLHAAAPSQCLIISIIVIILILLIILIIIIRLAIRIFRHPFATYPTVRWKCQVRASIGTAKVTLGFVLTLTVFFFPRTMRVSDNIPPNGSLNRLSDDQPWQSWGALFSAPDISVQLWMSSFMPVHGSWTTPAGVTSQRPSSFCQSGDLLAHDVHIDKPKAWCQQKRARSHVGFRTEWSPASPVTQHTTTFRFSSRIYIYDYICICIYVCHTDLYCWNNLARQWPIPSHS